MDKDIRGDLITKTIWVIGAMYQLCKYKRRKIEDLKKILNLRIKSHNSIKGTIKVSINDDELETIIEELYIHGVIGRGDEGEDKVVFFHACCEESGMPAGLFRIIRETDLIDF